MFPAVTDTPEGWVVMVSPPEEELTVSFAALEVADCPLLSFTTHRN